MSFYRRRGFAGLGAMASDALAAATAAAGAQNIAWMAANGWPLSVANITNLVTQHAKGDAELAANSAETLAALIAYPYNGPNQVAQAQAAHATDVANAASTAAVLAAFNVAMAPFSSVAAYAVAYPDPNAAANAAAAAAALQAQAQAKIVAEQAQADANARLATQMQAASDARAVAARGDAEQQAAAAAHAAQVQAQNDAAASLAVAASRQAAADAAAQQAITDAANARPAVAGKAIPLSVSSTQPVLVEPPLSVFTLAPPQVPDGTPILTHTPVDLPHGTPVVAPNGQDAHADGQGGLIAGAAPQVLVTLPTSMPTAYIDPGSSALPADVTTASSAPAATASAMPSWLPWAAAAGLAFLLMSSSRRAA